MRFSVIMPVYNKAAYLEGSIRSVLRQEFLHELIAVDDGSDDGGGAVLDRLAAEDGRVKVFHRKNAGVSAARNAGISMLTGDFVCFADGDDLLEEGFFRQAAESLSENECDIAFFAYKKRPHGKETFLIPSPAKGLFSARDAMTLLYKHQKETGYFGCVTNKLTKTELVKGCAFDTGLSLAEDLDFWIQIMNKSKSCLFSDIISFFYMAELPGSSSFDRVDYYSQLVILRRYKALLVKKQADFDKKELDALISRYVFFCVTDAVLKNGGAAGKRMLVKIFGDGLLKKDIVTVNAPLFQKYCLFLLKRGFNAALFASIKLKNTIKGKKDG